MRWEGERGGRAGEGKGTPKVMVAINTHVTDGVLRGVPLGKNQQSVRVVWDVFCLATPATFT